jgi:hypothetical protein
VENHTRKDDVVAALDGNATAGDKRPPRVFPLGLAVIKFKEKRETGSDAEIGLAENNKMSDV